MCFNIWCMTCYGMTSKRFLSLKIKHVLKHCDMYLNKPCTNGWGTAKEQHLVSSLSKCNHEETKQNKKPEDSTFSKYCFHCCFVPNLHRNIDIHTSFQTFKHLEECAWQRCNTEVRGGVPFFFLLSALAASLSVPWFNVHIYSMFLCHR